MRLPGLAHHALTVCCGVMVMDGQVNGRNQS